MSAQENAHRLRDLEAELAAIRAQGGYGSASAGLAAFDRLGAEMAWQGRPMGMLNTRSPDEDERFFAFTIQGPDGHVYWNGGKTFTRNDGKSRKPLRWWWAHSYTPLVSTDDLTNTCGDYGCINPEHHVKDRSKRREWYSDSAVIGALQVGAMQLGYSPGAAEWERLGRKPSRITILTRFGSWSRALSAAGLEPARRYWRVSSPESAIAALRQARRYLGHWPSRRDFVKSDVRDDLHRHGLPSAPHTIYAYLGNWPTALRKAGKR